LDEDEAAAEPVELLPESLDEDEPEDDDEPLPLDSVLPDSVLPFEPSLPAATVLAPLRLSVR
jgi:hypothetical protein